MRLVKPKKLSNGDLIGIISPASSPDDLEKINKGVKYLESLGYKTVVGKNVGKYHGYLAGSDKERLTDLHNMFANKEVKAVICVRGGYGTPRLLDKIDYNLIKKNPKVFVGYSDITALSMAFLKKAGLVTFAGPMLAVDLGEETDSYTEENFWKMVTNNKAAGRIETPDDDKLYCLNKGNASGKVIGGNLALLSSLVGTDYMPSFKDKILFLEEVGENPYRIDRLLNQLKLAKVFKEISGIVLGAFTECNESDPQKRTLTLGEVIEDYFHQLKIPVIYNFPHGHIKAKVTLPFGINAKINASRCFVEFTEPAVS